MQVRINLSGHANQALDDAGYIFPGVLHVDPTNPGTAVDTLIRVFRDLGVGSGTTVHVAVPGMSSLAVLAVSVLHGLTGQFPFVTYLVRNQDGSFGIGGDLDLQSTRNDVARVSRDGVIIS